MRPRRKIKIKQFSVDDYYKMIETGILLENPHEEILDGILYEMPSSTPRNAAVTSFLCNHFHRKFDDANFSIHQYRPVRLDDFNELVPDILFLKKREDSYRNGHPKANDVLVLIEIADQTLDFDKVKKFPVYRKFEIPEIWFVNLLKNLVETYTNPNNGIYKNVKIHTKGEIVKSETIPHLEIEVNKILGE